MVDRRTFLAATGGAVAMDPIARAVAAIRPYPTVHAWSLRTITYNVLACRGFMGTDPDQSVLRRMAPQISARLALELALYEPDVITLQESPAESVCADIAKRLGMHYAYFPGGFPGTVLTRHEIVESVNSPVSGEPHTRDMFTRHWGKAILKTPDGTLALYTAHLYPGGGEERQAIREREVSAMLAAMQSDLESDRSVILQGDLNLGPDNDLYPRFAKAGLRDAFEEKGSGQELTGTSDRPRWRVDYIMSAGPIADHLQSCRVLFEGAFRTNPEDPSSVALSDHLPVLAVFA